MIRLAFVGIGIPFFLLPCEEEEVDRHEALRRVLHTHRSLHQAMNDGMAVPVILVGQRLLIGVFLQRTERLDESSAVTR